LYVRTAGGDQNEIVTPRVAFRVRRAARAAARRFGLSPSAHRATVRALERRCTAQGEPMNVSPSNVRTPGGIVVPAHTLRLLVRNVERGKPTLLVGPTGSAKTLLASEIAALCGRRLEVFQFSMIFDSEAAIVGTVALEQGETRFARSRFVEAVSTPGCVVLLDELNRGPGPATNALLSLADGQGRIAVDLDRGARRVVRRAPGVTLLATANVGAEYTHTEAFDQALLNRFLIVRLGFPEDEQALLVERGLSPADAAWAVRIATEVRKATDRGQLPAMLTTRGLFEVAELVRDAFPMEQAVESVMAVFDDAGVAALRAIVRATK
jgi:nitric oxide reductase NorQ protein